MKRFGRLPDSDAQNDFLKTLLVAMAALLILSAAALGYIYYKSKPRGLSDDPELAELETLEFYKDYPKLINTLYGKREKSFSEKVLPWLKEREDKGFAPYYYAQALHLNNLRKQQEAILYFFAGGLVARVDLLRCLDKTAEVYIAALESPFPDVPAFLEVNPGVRVSAGTFAIEMEEFTRDRPPADWLCTQGDNEQMKHDPYFPDEEWWGRRELTIESFKKAISERPIEEEADPKSLPLDLPLPPPSEAQ